MSSERSDLRRASERDLERAAEYQALSNTAPTAELRALYEQLRRAWLDLAKHDAGMAAGD